LAYSLAKPLESSVYDGVTDLENVLVLGSQVFHLVENLG